VQGVGVSNGTVFKYISSDVYAFFFIYIQQFSVLNFGLDVHSTDITSQFRDRAIELIIK
jgi:hypothetical protein